MFKNSNSKLKDVMGLYKASFVLIGKDQDLLKPMVWILTYKLINTLLVFSMLYCYFVLKNTQYGVGLVLTILAFAPISTFLQMRMQAALSWMAHEVVAGKDTDMDSGSKRLKGNNLVLILFSIVSRTLASRNNKDEQGLKGMVTNLLLSVLAEVWDIVHNFLIPVLVIENKSLKETVQELKLLKKNVPAVIAGTLGTDIAEGIIGALFGGPFFLITLLAIGTGYYLHDFFPADWSMSVDKHHFNFLPLVITLFLQGMAFTVLSTLAQGVKAIYYSVFYTTLAHPLKVEASLRQDVTNYLNFQGSTKGYQFFDKILASTKEEAELQVSRDGVHDQKTVDKIKDAFASNLSKGHPVQVVKDFLMKKKIANDLIDYAFTEYLEETTNKVLPLVKQELTKGNSKEAIESFLKQKGYPSCLMENVFEKVS